MSGIPEDVRRLAAEREAARRSKDFAAADVLRGRIRQAGFDVIDTAEGPELRPAPPAGAGTAVEPEPLRAEQIVSVLDQPAAFDATVLWVVEGWPEDVGRGIGSFAEHHPGA